MAGVHEDFGEKIGGAKKDLWKDRGLYADDLEAMNEREAEKFVKRIMSGKSRTMQSCWRKGFLLAWSILSKSEGRLKRFPSVLPHG